MSLRPLLPSLAIVPIACQLLHASTSRKATCRVRRLTVVPGPFETHRPMGRSTGKHPNPLAHVRSCACMIVLMLLAAARPATGQELTLPKPIAGTSGPFKCADLDLCADPARAGWRRLPERQFNVYRQRIVCASAPCPQPYTIAPRFPARGQSAADMKTRRGIERIWLSPRTPEHHYRPFERMASNYQGRTWQVQLREASVWISPDGRRALIRAGTPSLVPLRAQPTSAASASRLLEERIEGARVEHKRVPPGEDIRRESGDRP